MPATTTDEVTATDLDTLIATLRHKVDSGEITLAHLQWFLALTCDELDALVEDVEEDEPTAVATSILHPLVGALKIAATDGKDIIPNASDVFTGYIDGDFVRWDANQPSDATLEITTTVYEMRQDVTLKQMFDSLSTDTKKLCMTQSQIIGFVKTHRQHLRTDGYATLFLFESNGKFFVASVYFLVDGRLGVDVRRFEVDFVWRADDRVRVVVPQL